MTAETPKRRFRLRFSILNLLFVATIIAMGLSIYRLYRENQGFRKTLGDAGFLDVRDESKYHAIAIPTYDELTWRWRVWLPEGKRYQLVAKLNDLSPNQDVFQFVPPVYDRAQTNIFGPNVALDGNFGLPPGEHLLAVAIRNSEGTPRITFQGDGITVHQEMQIGKSDWPFDGSGRGGEITYWESPRNGSTDQPNLFLLRCMDTDQQQRPNSNGILIWIEPIDE